MMRTLITSIALSFVVSASAARPYFNDLKVPESAEDLLAIQNALQGQLEQARAATVCVKLSEGSGSGVIISEDGLVLSAAHVTAGVQKELKILLEDGREFEAVSLGLNAKNDAAMLQIKSDEKFPYVEVESKSEGKQPMSQVGDWVFALGHSGGFDKQRGSVVRLGRMVRVTEQTVRTDCLLIGGDSGGPLFDMNGKLIAIHSRVGGHASQNMHVPLQAFHQDWSGLKESQFIGKGPFAKKSKPGSGFLGILVNEDSGQLEVSSVEAGYAAAKAGVKVGDVLLELDGEKVRTSSDLKEVLAKKAAGDKLSVLVLRSGKELSLEVKLTSK